MLLKMEEKRVVLIQYFTAARVRESPAYSKVREDYERRKAAGEYNSS